MPRRYPWGRARNLTGARSAAAGRAKSCGRSFGSVAGRYKQFFDKGTIRGTFALTFGPDAAGNVEFTGTAKIAAGTGAYARTRGTAAIACEPRDPATHIMQCTETARLTAR